MKVKAAVYRELHEPLTIEDVELAEPGPEEVLIKTAACGVCHSDLHALHGAIPSPKPAIFGHEPAGIVVDQCLRACAGGDQCDTPSLVTPRRRVGRRRSRHRF